MRKVSGLMLATAALVSLTSTRHACALEFTTDVSNYSGSRATVDVYAKGTTGPATRYSTLHLADGTMKTTTFLGMTYICLSYLTGTAGDNKPITPMSCSGVENSTTERCCGNYKFKVVNKGDGTYHFQKIQ